MRYMDLYGGLQHPSIFRKILENRESEQTHDNLILFLNLYLHDD